MGHTPYGYTITDGIAVIDETAATRIRCLYKNYLAGMSLTDAAKNAGIETYHGTAKRLLTNSHYIGDDFYPAIIDKNTFALAAQEIHKRTDKLGRTNKIPKVSTKYAPTHFSIKKADDNFPDPFKQAEYIYSLIESEVL